MNMKIESKLFNHEIWWQCNCGYQFDLRETCICPKCKTHKAEENGI